MLRITGNAKLNQTYNTFTSKINDTKLDSGLVLKHFTNHESFPQDVNFNTYAIALLNQKKKSLQDHFDSFKEEMDKFNGVELSKETKRLLVANVWELVSLKFKALKHLRSNIDRHVSYLQSK